MREIDPTTGMVKFEPTKCNQHRQRRAKPGELEAIIAAGVRGQTDDCIVWPFSIDAGKANGYAKCRGQYAHRIVCLAAHGRAPIWRNEDIQTS